MKTLKIGLKVKIIIAVTLLTGLAIAAISQQ